MKCIKIILPLVLTILLFTCNEAETIAENTFTVSGTIKGLDTDYMSRSYKDENGERVSDSIFVQEDYFSYTATIEKPTHIIFWPNVERTIKRSGRGYYPAKSSQFAFLASPGDEIVFSGEVTDFINAYPSGSAANDDLAEINRQVFPLLNQSVNTLLEKNKLTEDDTISIKLLEDSIQALDEEVIRLKKEFLQTNQNSEAAVWYLSDMMMRSQVTDEEAIKMFNNISSDLETYPYYQEIAMRVEGIESTLTGKVVPDFSTTNTLDGTEFTFSELRGKYVLIDFWGTWCAPCVAEMPKLKAYQAKYSEELVVLGINSGDTKEKIIDFITPKEYTWTQLLAGKGNDNLVLKFNVSGFPTKFIIDPNGKILNRFVGDGEGSFAALDELLK